MGAERARGQGSKKYREGPGLSGSSHAHPKLGRRWELKCVPTTEAPFFATLDPNS